MAEKRIYLLGKPPHRSQWFNLSPKRSTHICTSLAGQAVGLSEVEEKMWRLQFLDIILGHYDEENKHFSPMKEMVLL